MRTVSHAIVNIAIRTNATPRVGAVYLFESLVQPSDVKKRQLAESVESESKISQCFFEVAIPNTGSEGTKKDATNFPGGIPESLCGFRKRSCRRTRCSHPPDSIVHRQNLLSKQHS